MRPRVVGDDEVTDPFESPRAVQDIAAGRGDPMTEDDWRPLPRNLATNRQSLSVGEGLRLREPG